jgi:integrase
MGGRDMIPRPKLTDSIARNAEPPDEGMRIVWDGEVRGFGLRVTASSVKAWLLAYRADGVQRQFTFGSYPAWTATQARERAKELKRQVEQGGDPMRDRHEERATPTLGELAEAYQEHMLRRSANSQRAVEHTWRLHILPALGKGRRITTISDDDVAKMHRKVSATKPVTANRAVAQLSAAFNLAIKKKYCTTNPCIGIEMNYEAGRERYLSPAEIERLMAALASHPHRSSCNALQLLLLTGARKNEVLFATWDQFNLDLALWIKPAASTKQKKLHRLVLNSAAVALLTDIYNEQLQAVEAAKRRGAIKPMRFLFPGHIPGSPLREVRETWLAVCKTANIEDCHIHDLRHTHASILASNGMSLPVIGQLLGHSQQSTTQRYAHLLDSALRQASEEAGNTITGKRDSGVVKLRSAG